MQMLIDPPEEALALPVDPGDATVAIEYVALGHLHRPQEVAGAGSLATVVNEATGNQARFNEMKNILGDVGEGFKAGVWEDTPIDRPEFKKKQRAKLGRKPVEEMGSC